MAMCGVWLSLRSAERSIGNRGGRLAGVSVAFLRQRFLDSSGTFFPLPSFHVRSVSLLGSPQVHVSGGARWAVFRHQMVPPIARVWSTNVQIPEFCKSGKIIHT